MNLLLDELDKLAACNFMHSPLISIIVPTLNQGKFIGQALESIFSQDYPNIEVIVMDGGSTDGTVSLLKEYALRVRDEEFGKDKHLHWESKKDRGQAHALNKGLKKSMGTIITYINSDDYYSPDAIKTVVDFFSVNPLLSWVTGDYRIVDAKRNIIQEPIRRYKKILRRLPIRWILAYINPIVQPSTFLRSRIVKDIGYFDESLKYVFDYDYWIRIARKYKAGRISSVLSFFRIHHGAKGSVSYMKQFSEEIRVLKKYEKNPIVIFLHSIHNKLIIWVYNVIKKRKTY